MFHDLKSAEAAAELNSQTTDFAPKDRAAAVTARLEVGNETQQTVAAVISAATADYECSDCGSNDDPFVFLLQDEIGCKYLALACPVCRMTN